MVAITGLLGPLSHQVHNRHASVRGDGATRSVLCVGKVTCGTGDKPGFSVSPSYSQQSPVCHPQSLRRGGIQRFNRRESVRLCADSGPVKAVPSSSVSEPVRATERPSNSFPGYGDSVTVTVDNSISEKGTCRFHFLGDLDGTSVPLEAPRTRSTTNLPPRAHTQPCTGPRSQQSLCSPR